MKSFILFLFVFLVACTVPSTSTTDENTDTVSDAERVDVLYYHTIQMKDFASASTLEELGLDMAVFPENDSLLTVDEKLSLLAESYQTNNTDIGYLEERMIQMMDEWVALEYDE